MLFIFNKLYYIELTLIISITLIIYLFYEKNHLYIFVAGR